MTTDLLLAFVLNVALVDCFNRRLGTRHDVDNRGENLDFWYQPDIFDSAIAVPSNTIFNETIEFVDQPPPPLSCEKPRYADLNIYPYSAGGVLFARVNNNTIRECAAQYIASNWSVVTAAHCVHFAGAFADHVIFVQQYDAKTTAASAGALRQKLRRVRSIHVDQRYLETFAADFDYALLRMADASTGSFFELASTDSHETESLSAIGYPLNHFDGKFMLRDKGGRVGGVSGKVFTKQESSFGSAEGAIGGAIFVDRTVGPASRVAVGIIVGALTNSRCVLYSPMLDGEFVRSAGQLANVSLPA